MVRNVQAFQSQPMSPILEMSWTVGYHTGRDPKRGTQSTLVSVTFLAEVSENE